MEDIFLEKLKVQLAKKQLWINSIDNQGILYIENDGIEMKIDLENIRRTYERDKNEMVIVNLVNSIINSSLKIPNWSIIKADIYTSFVPNDCEFGEFVHKKITDQFSKIYIYYCKHGQIWISEKNIEEWFLTEQELDTQTDVNACASLNLASITSELIEDRKLGIINTEHTSLKSALLFASNMKDKVYNEFGFPFYAILPVRDFCYIFSENDYEFFSSRLGNTVAMEYKESDYPITTELLKFTASGVEVIGNYPVE